MSAEHTAIPSCMELEGSVREHPVGHPAPPGRNGEEPKGAPVWPEPRAGGQAGKTREPPPSQTQEG